jgi:hypothetical protein
VISITAGWFKFFFQRIQKDHTIIWK